MQGTVRAELLCVFRFAFCKGSSWKMIHGQKEKVVTYWNETRYNGILLNLFLIQLDEIFHFTVSYLVLHLTRFLISLKERFALAIILSRVQ
jgi:hypothetical protein